MTQQFAKLKIRHIRSHNHDFLCLAHLVTAIFGSYTAEIWSNLLLRRFKISFIFAQSLFSFPLSSMDR